MTRSRRHSTHHLDSITNDTTAPLHYTVAPKKQALQAEGAALSKKINGSYRFLVDDSAWVLDLKVVR